MERDSAVRRLRRTAISSNFLVDWIEPLRSAIFHGDATGHGALRAEIEPSISSRTSNLKRLMISAPVNFEDLSHQPQIPPMVTFEVALPKENLVLPSELVPGDVNLQTISLINR